MADSAQAVTSPTNNNNNNMMNSSNTCYSLSNQAFQNAFFTSAAAAYPVCMADASRYLDENFLLISVTLMVLILATFLYLINRPIARFKRLEEIGYLSDGLHPKKTISDNTRRRRQAGDVPPPFPNGWYFVAYSQHLKKGEVKEVFVLGQQLAVFRGEDGKAAVLDAYCPHMGANLAVGGIVTGCALQCPFHGWKFDGEGNCVEIPYSQQPIPKTAKTKKWVTLERNCQILVWFNADGEAPTWEPREYPNLQGQYKMAGITENFINCHIQEIPENGADLAHLTYLHSPLILSGSDLRTNRSLLNIISHNWVGRWYTLEEHHNDPSLKHIACLELTHHLHLFGRHISMFDFHVQAFQEGPALVFLTWKFALGTGAFMQTLNPQEPLLLKVGHTIWTHKWLPNIIGRILMLSEISQVDRDITIWNNKKYTSKPLLVKEDKSIGQFRRWYSQFYSEGSREYGKRNNLDW